MRLGRFAPLASVLAVLLACALAPGGTGRAQEATPGACGTQTQWLTGAAGITLARITFEPGCATAPGPDPFAALAYVDSGTVTLQADQAVMIFTGGVPFGAEPGIPTEPGVPTEVRAGESFLTLPGISFQVSNPGTEPAVVLVVIFQPPMDQEAAPPTAATPTT